MYMSKAKRETMQSMVLAHRVAIRKHQQAERGSNEWFDTMSNETITQYAVEAALGDDDGHKVEHIRLMAEHDNATAYVALIRLEKMGVA